MSRRYATILSVLTTCILLAVTVTPSTGSGQPASTGSGQTASTGSGQAGPPRIINGQVSATTAGAGLRQTFTSMVAAQGDVLWIGYAVPVKDRDRVMCCWSNGSSSSCAIDSAMASAYSSSAPLSPSSPQAERRTAPAVSTAPASSRAGCRRMQRP